MNAAEFLEFLRGEFTITPKMEERFLSLDSLYRDWNSRINVISRKDIDGIYSHHVLHSLAVAKYLSLDPALWEKFSHGRILDLGTGGGFPGIPLAILFPGADFVLCDSVGKKTTVAGAVAGSIGLDNVSVVNERAEKLPGVFDFVVSRAVASLEDLLPWVKGKYTDSLICLKGGDIVQEAASARIAPSRVHTFPIDAWLKDPYYQGKWVVGIDSEEK